MTLVHHASGVESTIIDGGTLSNFPVWLFDTDTGTPCRPTFGFTLTGGKGVGQGLHRVEQRLPWGLRIGFDMFHTAQETWDERFVSHSTRVRTLAVDAGDVATTDFALSPERQAMLIANGRKAASEFLAGFEIENYMNTFHKRLDEPVAVTA